MAVAETSGASALTCRTCAAVDGFNDRLKTQGKGLSLNASKSHHCIAVMMYHKARKNT